MNQELARSFEIATRRWRIRLLVTGLLALLFLLAGFSLARAVNRGQYGAVSPERQEFFNGLSSDRGPCCSTADGVLISPDDWKIDAASGSYMVLLYGKWFRVPWNAMVRQRNTTGEAWVWPRKDFKGETIIQCFMPGSEG